MSDFGLARLILLVGFLLLLAPAILRAGRQQTAPFAILFWTGLVGLIVLLYEALAD
jgi:uncharacterized integral membrane protein